MKPDGTLFHHFCDEPLSSMCMFRLRVIFRVVGQCIDSLIITLLGIEFLLVLLLIEKIVAAILPLSLLLYQLGALLLLCSMQLFELRDDSRKQAVTNPPSSCTLCGGLTLAMHLVMALEVSALWVNSGPSQYTFESPLCKEIRRWLDSTPIPHRCS